MTEIDKSYRIFKEYLSELNAYIEMPISEADTRSKILDKIFIGVLGWSESDIQREKFVQVGYYDYEISTAIFHFVVEAKKTFVHFRLPDKGSKVKLRTIYKSNKEIIDQIRSYLFNTGMAYGVLSNGNQFVIGRFVNTDGSDWLDNDVVFFRDLENIDRNFVEFYNILSKEAVNHHGRFKLFKENNQGKTIVRSNNLKRKDDELVRNKISHELIPIITEVFEEISGIDDLKEQDILNECYISNDDIKKYNSELGFIFSDVPPTFDSRISPVQNTTKTQQQLTANIVGVNNSLPDPIILIGGKGAGKTTFIRYFLEVVLEKNVKKNRPVLYLDFRNETEYTIKNTQHIYKKLLLQLYKEYDNLNLQKLAVLKLIYKSEIENNKIGIWSHIISEEKLNEKISDYLEKQIEDSISHLQKISNYLITKNNKRLCIIFDNADQLDDHIQKDVFLLGHSLHRNLKVIVIISLREGYFYKWKNKPPFDAYHSTVFHITAPPYRDVLRKRIKYVLGNFKFPTIKINNENLRMELSEGSLTHLFQNLYKALFEISNSEILSFLEETSYPNIRNGLEKFKFFLLSGHTKTDLYMSIEYGRDGKKSIPIWEFVKSVALESHYYYNTEQSCVFNIFHPSPNNRNHFTKIRLLDYIIDYNVEVGKRNQFVAISLIVSAFASAGYSQDILLEELQLLYNAGLIFTNDFMSDIESEVSLTSENHIGITQAGVFYLKVLIEKFYYLDLVLQDTPIYSDKYFSEMSDLFPESDTYGNRDLLKRVAVTKKFIEYLSMQEAKDHNRIDKDYGVKCLDKQIMNSIKQARDIERIEVLREFAKV